MYCKILNDCDFLNDDYFPIWKYDGNNIANLINNDNYKHDITLLVDDSKIFIYEKDRYLY